MLILIHLFVISLFVVLGMLFNKGKGASLISGYNTLSEREKRKIDEKSLCKCMSKLMFCLATCWGAVAIGNYLDKMWLLLLGFIMFIIAIIIAIIYMNTKNRFKKNN